MTIDEIDDFPCEKNTLPSSWKHQQELVGNLKTTVQPLTTTKASSSNDNHDDKDWELLEKFKESSNITVTSSSKEDVEDESGVTKISTSRELSPPPLLTELSPSSDGEQQSTTTNTTNEEEEEQSTWCSSPVESDNESKGSDPCLVTNNKSIELVEQQTVQKSVLLSCLEATKRKEDENDVDSKKETPNLTTGGGTVITDNDDDLPQDQEDTDAPASSDAGTTKTTTSTTTKPSLIEQRRAWLQEKEKNYRRQSIRDEDVHPLPPSKNSSITIGDGNTISKPEQGDGSSSCSSIVGEEKHLNAKTEDAEDISAVPEEDPTNNHTHTLLAQVTTATVQREVSQAPKEQRRHSSSMESRREWLQQKQNDQRRKSIRDEDIPNKQNSGSSSGTRKKWKVVASPGRIVGVQKDVAAAQKAEEERQEEMKRAAEAAAAAAAAAAARKEVEDERAAAIAKNKEEEEERLAAEAKGKEEEATRAIDAADAEADAARTAEEEWLAGEVEATARKVEEQMLAKPTIVPNPPFQHRYKISSSTKRKMQSRSRPTTRASVLLQLLLSCVVGIVVASSVAWWWWPAAQVLAASEKLTILQDHICSPLPPNQLLLNSDDIIEGAVAPWWVPNPYKQQVFRSICGPSRRVQTELSWTKEEGNLKGSCHHVLTIRDYNNNNNNNGKPLLVRNKLEKVFLGPTSLEVTTINAKSALLSVWRSVSSLKRTEIIEAPWTAKAID